MKKCNFGHLRDQCNTHKKGSSSFKMHDPEYLFKKMNIKKGDHVLDLGCGPGDYSIKISEIIGEKGIVDAIDINEEVIEYLNQRLTKKGIKNVNAIKGSLTEPFQIKDNSIDVCIIVTVLHAINIKNNGTSLFKEIYRALKPKGRLITIDCKKEKTEFGPPISMRIAPEELESLGNKCGLRVISYSDLGYNYMIQFEK